MILSITGGRFHTPSYDCIQAFLSFIDDLNITHLHHGASGSVDWGISTVVCYYYPDIVVTPWPVDTSIDVDGPWPAAGNRRNTRMLIESKSQALCKFPGNRGTQHCYSEAKRLNLLTFVWDEQKRCFTGG